MASQPIYQFYAELAEYQPAIWRRFQVAGNISLARLGYILMTLFEMQASHLFCFNVPVWENYRSELKRRIGQEIEDKDCDFGLPGICRYEVKNEELFPDGGMDEADDAAETKLRDVVRNIGDRLTLEYDYGDGWQVAVVLESIHTDKELPARELPRVLEGAGFGIIEDCGGPGGLEELAKAFQKKKGPAYREYRDWLGVDDLDLAAFDMDDMNFRLKKLPRIFTELYEYSYAPTDRSMVILERRYKK